MKKALYIVLVMIVFLQSGGLFLVYKIRQGLVRVEMQREVRENSGPFITLTVPLDEYLRARAGHDELFYHGCLYDVRSMEICGSSVVLQAIKDTRETAISKTAGNIARGDGLQHKAHPPGYLNFMAISFMPGMNIESPSPVWRQPACALHGPGFTAPPLTDIPNPPPETI